MKYFQNDELACRCGCGKMPSEEIQELADMLREHWGKPLYCTSGARCDAHTAFLRARGIPAALYSAHNEGLAIDLTTKYVSEIDDLQKWVIDHAEDWGYYVEDPKDTPTWVHIQLRKPGSGKRVFKA